MNSSAGGEDFEDVDLWLRSLHGLVLSILLVASLAGNSFLLILVLSNKTLQYRSVLSSLGLVAADLIITVAWCTQALASIVAGRCPFGELGCSILGTLTNMGIYARWCTIALITLERFCKILFPFCYIRYSKPLLIALSILCWAIPIATTVIPEVAGVGTYTFRLAYSTCIVTCDADETACFRFFITLYGLFVSIGGILPMILYFLLCIVGHQKAYKMKHIKLGTFKQSSAVEEGRSAHCNEQDLDSSKSPDNSISPSTSQLDSTSTGSSWGGPLEKKILITFFLIFVNVFATQLPIYATSTLRSSEAVYTKIPLAVHFIFVHIYLLGPVFDPLLIMRNKDFRDVIRRRWRRRQAQRSLKQSSVTNTLLEFSKISSLLDIQQGTRRSTRRNSCPGSTYNVVFVPKQTTYNYDVVFVPKINKSRSLDGGCVSMDKNMTASSGLQIRTAVEGEHQRPPIMESREESHQASGTPRLGVDER